MTTERAAMALARLMRALPKEPLSRETFSVYVDDLADIEGQILDDAVAVIIRSRRDPWFPTIGEIRAAAAELYLALPAEREALAQVEARIQWGRERAGSAPAVHPLVGEALTLVGGYPAFRESEDPQATRGRFARVYRDLRASAITERAVGLEPVNPMLEP